MTREFLKNLGLEDSAVDKVLDENSRDIGREKQRAESAKADLTAARERRMCTRSRVFGRGSPEPAGLPRNPLPRVRVQRRVFWQRALYCGVWPCARRTAHARRPVPARGKV